MPESLLDLSDPVNRHHPLNFGRAAWWLVVPGIDGGRQLFDLMGLYHGTLTNGPSWRATTRRGGWGAMLFDDVTQGIVSGFPPLGQSFTIALWAYHAADQPGFECELVTQDDSGANRVFRFSLAGTSDGGNVGKMRFIYRPSTAASIYSATPVPLATWTRIAVAKSSDDNYAFYVNGVLDATVAGGAVGTAAAGSTTIGLPGGGGNTPAFSGPLDDIAIWSRPLSPAEMRADYELSSRGYPGVLNRRTPGMFALAAAPPPGSSAASLAMALRPGLVGDGSGLLACGSPR